MRLTASFWHDYEPFYRRGHWNWVDYTFINVSVERTHYIDCFEVHLGILGLHLNLALLWGGMK